MKKGVTSYNFGGNRLTLFQIGTQITAHALLGGVAEDLRGGKFAHGMLSAGLPKVIMGGLHSRLGKIGPYGRTALAAAIGGTVSARTGGKFANGAITAAVQHWYNQERGASVQKGLDAELVKKYNALKARVTRNLAEVDGAVPTLSKSELALIVNYEVERIKLIDPKLTNYIDNMVGADPAPSDTFFRSFGGAAFFIEGVGSVRAGHINYIGVGMMAAHYGAFAESMLDGQVINWNLLQAGLGGGRHNLTDIPENRFWAQKGIEYYDSH